MDELLPVEPVRPPSPARRRLFVIVTLVVVAAFVVVGALGGSGFILRSGPAPTVEATATPASEARLVVVDLDGGLSVIDSSGTRIANVPASGAGYQFPAWSPDASRIAAIRTDDAGTSLDVLDLVGAGKASDAPGGRTTVYASADEPVFYLYWAPDGRAIAFLSTEPDGLALRRAPADAGSPTGVVRTGAPMYWQWVDPTRLLVHSGGSAVGAFAGEVGLDGTPAGSGDVGRGSFRVPALSSDGRYLASGTIAADGTMALVVATRDGSSHHDVAIGGAAAFEFGPADDTLAFTSPAGAGTSGDLAVGPLRAMDATTGTVRTLLDGSVVGFFWAPDGRTIAAISVATPGDTNVASTHTAPVALARMDGSAQLAAAGITLRLTFVDAVSGAIRSVREIQLADLFVNQVLPYFDQYALSHRFWSPDSRSVALPIVSEQGVSRIALFAADGSDPVELVDGQFAAWSP